MTVALSRPATPRAGLVELTMRHAMFFVCAALLCTAVALLDLRASPHPGEMTLAGHILCAVIAIGSVALAVRVNRLMRCERELGNVRADERARSELALQYERFDIALRNMCQGLAMYDGAGRLIVCNDRYRELYNLPAALTVAGTSRDKILRYREAIGAGRSSRKPEIASDGSETIINELIDGRIIAQRKQQLADGGWVSTHEDITARCRAERQVSHMALHDPLTDLPNRTMFRERLHECLAEVARGGRFAVLYLDLDRFKPVNDSLGHPAGDALLKQVTARLTATTRGGDFVARLGGDEFAIIQRLKIGPTDAVALATRAIARISEPYTIDGHEVVIGTSIGISLAPEDSDDAETLIRNADMALYHTKEKGRGSFNFFQPSMDAQMRNRRQLELDLRRAVAENQFELHFQPIVDLADRQIRAFEALLRWNRPDFGMMPPDQFIPLAEEIGLIVPIGEWVLHHACRLAATWPSHIKVAVNISAVQFKSARLIGAIQDAMSDAELGTGRLDIEITESVMLNDADNVLAILLKLRELGICVALDDFGTGYSSLSYLHRFPFDKIKIDKTFVRAIGKREGSHSIVSATALLARSLGMATVAEGIETEEQFARVRLEGCTEAQGYFISRPVPAAAIPALIEQHARALVG